jgi:hypothetical protein
MVRERPQVLVLITLPAEQVTEGVPQSSVAVGAVVLAQVGTVGLHPKSVPGVQLVNTGGVLSTTTIVVQQTSCPSSHVMVSQRLNVSQAAP